MKFFSMLTLVLSLFSFSGKAQNKAPLVANDSMTLAQAYINLYLTEMYFDTLPVGRISKILPFEAQELSRIKDSSFISQHSELYNFTHSLWHLNKANLLYRTKTAANRQELMGWRNTLGEAIQYYSKSDARYSEDLSEPGNPFFEMISFDLKAVANLENRIHRLKWEFTPYFNQDIYPDFKRLFYAAKNQQQYHFDSLIHFAGIYHMPLSLSILNNEYGRNWGRGRSIGNEYDLDPKLDLISKYLQLHYLAFVDHAEIPGQFDRQVLYDSYADFLENLKEVDFGQDSFFASEFDTESIDLLYQQLQTKFPFPYSPEPIPHPVGSAGPKFKNPVMYFFPDPAPLASAKLTVKNYRPRLTTLGRVDSFLSTELEKAGFKDHLHYFYTLDGFALATSLEKFNKSGTRVDPESRFSKTLGGDGKFSYFEVFKSLFFEMESDFRMLVFIVASDEVTFSNRAMSANFAGDLLINSYETLPEDLKNKPSLHYNLTVLVYHFHQNDIGEVPMLDLTGQLTVKEHLSTAGLSGLIRVP